MSLLAELLAANAVTPSQLVLGRENALKLATGDLLKLPRGQGTQVLRQGQDLVVLVDVGNNRTPERVLVVDFFAPGSLGLVQIGSDGSADMVTPRSDVAFAPTGPVPQATASGQNAVTPSPEAQQTAEQGAEQSGGVATGQLYQELGVNDTTGAEAAPSFANQAASESLAELVAGVELGKSQLLASPVPEYFGGNRLVATALFAAPTLDALANGAWINAGHKQTGYAISGEGANGTNVELRFVSSTSGRVVVHTVTVQNGLWSDALSGAEIALLGEGGLSVTVQQLASGGQVVSPALTLALTIDTVAPKVPTFTTPTAINDGVINADDVSDQSLVFTVIAEPGSTVIVSLTDDPGKVAKVSGVAGPGGICLIDIKPVLNQLDDGLVIYSVQSVDAAGNTSVISAQPDFSLQQKLPAAPVAAMLAADDNGLSQADGVTNNTAPRFSVTAQDQVVAVRVYKDSKNALDQMDGVANPDELVATLTTKVNGAFIYQVNPALAANSGAQNFLFIAVDAYGNRSPLATASAFIDTSVETPSLNSVTPDDKLSYEEVLAPYITFSGTGEANSEVTLKLSANSTPLTPYVTTVNADGIWSVNVMSNVAGADNVTKSLFFGFGSDFAGRVKMEVQQTDLAGNTSGVFSREVYMRTTPVSQVSTLSLAKSDDTGRSNGDGVTNKPRFTVTGLGPASTENNNMKVLVYKDVNGNGQIDAQDVLLATLRTNNQGVFSGLVPDLDVGPLTDGPYTLITQVVDELSGTGSATTNIRQVLQVQVDTQVSAISFDQVAGNGIVTSDEIASGSLMISGDGEPNASVDLSFVAGTVELSAYSNIAVNAGGRWSVAVTADDINALGSTTVKLTGKQTDLAGNTTSTAKEITFNIKLGSLDAPDGLNMLAADDTGAFSDDDITAKSNGVRFSGTSAAAYNPQDPHTITLFRDANQNGLLDSGESLGTTTVLENGSFELTVNLPTGASQIRAIASNLAGQTSGSTAALGVVVDQTVSPVTELQITLDDKINATEVSNGSATVGGKAEGSATVETKFYDSSNLSTPIFTRTAVANAQGVWLLSLTPEEVAELQTQGQSGSWTVVATQTDLAGNLSGPASKVFSIDTVAPGAPSQTNLDAALAYNNDPARAWRSVSGVDAVTWSEVYEFNQGFAVPKTLQVAVALPSGMAVNETIKMLWGIKTVSHSITATDISRGYALVSITGDIIAANKADSNSANAAVSATFIDSAGNESSPALSVISAVNVTLAGTPPTLEPAFDAYTTYDNALYTYYSRNSSLNTDLGKQNFTVTGVAPAPNETVTIFNDVNLDGVAQQAEILATTTGEAFTGNFSAPLSLLPGTYKIRAISSDGQSPSTSPTNVQFVVIDLQPPAPPQLDFPQITANGYVTRALRESGVALTGTGEPGATLNLQLQNTDTGVLGTIYRDVTVNALGVWNATIGLIQWGQVGDGKINVRVSQTDLAGNTSDVYTSNGSIPQLIFDSVVAPPTVFQASGNDIINAEEAKSSTVFRGGGEPFGRVTLTFQGANGSIGPVNADTDVTGTWTYSLTSNQVTNTLGNGTLSVTAYQTDVAGNVSLSATRTMQVDMVVFAPQIAEISGGTVSAGEATLGVPISGTAEPFATVTVKIQGTSGVSHSQTTKATETGSWTVTFSGTQINQMGQGVCTVTANQVDVAENSTLTTVPPAPGTRTFVVATGPLTTPVVIKAVTGDDVVTVTEQNATGGQVIDGTAPANTTLTLTLEGARGTLSYSLEVGAGGTWSVPLDKDTLQNSLGSGSVAVRAFATNNQQQSTALASKNFTIEKPVLSATLSRVTSDDYVNAAEAQSTVSLNGGGLTGHVVKITVQGQSARFDRSALVDEFQKWSTPLSVGDLAALGNGTVTVTLVQAVSLASNAATSIATVNSFVIDTLPPGDPNASDISAANAYNTIQSAIAGGVNVAEAEQGVTVAVALPADAKAGESFTVKWGSLKINQVITAAMVPDSGSRVVNVLIPPATLVAQGDGVINVTAEFKDIAGNPSTTPQIIASQLSVFAPPPPPSINSIYGDNYINAVEFAQIQSLATPLTPGGLITGNAPDGGKVRLTLSNHDDLSVVFNDLAVVGGLWTAKFTPAQLLSLGEGPIIATALYTNARGAVSAPAVTQVIFDKTLPAAPDAQSGNFIEAANANARNELAGGLIRNDGQTTEAAKTVTVNVALATDVSPGELLTLFWGEQQLKIIVTSADVTRGFVEVPVSAFVMSNQGDSGPDGLLVQAHITDRAGNVGALYTVWTGKVDAIPLSPVVDDVSDNNYLNIQEVNNVAGWRVSGKGQANNTVIVTLTGTKLDSNNKPVTIVTDSLATRLEGDKYVWDVGLSKQQAEDLGEGEIKITSFQYDQNNNVSDPGKNPSDPSIRYFKIDLTQPGQPGINNVTTDNRVSFAEGQSDVTISGTGEDKASVSVKIKRGAKQHDKLTEVVGTSWSIILSPSELAALGGGTITLEVEQTDLAGNKSVLKTGSFEYTTTAVPPPEFTSVSGISIPPLSPDASFNLDDFNALSNANPFKISGTGTTGNEVRLSVLTEGGARLSYDLPVIAGTWTKTFTIPEFVGLGQGKINLSAIQITNVGDESVPTEFNPGTPDKSFLIDTAEPNLVSSVITGSGLNGNAKADDMLTVTVQASESLSLSGINTNNPPTLKIFLGGGQERLAVFDAAATLIAGADKLVFKYKVVNGDNATSLVADTTVTRNGLVLSDAAGNLSTNTIASAAIAAVRVDTVTPQTPSILSVDAEGLSTPGANKVNVQEAAQSFVVRVDLSGGTTSAGTRAQVGDTVELAWTSGPTGNQITNRLTKQVSVLDIQDDRLYMDINVGASTVGGFEGEASLRVLITDNSGNRSAQSSARTVQVDTIAPPAMGVTPLWMDDDKVKASEANAVSALTGSGYELGATIEATMVQGVTRRPVTVTPGVGSAWSILQADMQTAINNLADGAFTLELTQIDASGNQGPTSQANYYLDRVVPNAPTVTGVPEAADGWINLRDANTVGVKVNVSLTGTNAVAGDALVIGGFTTEFSYTLTTTDISSNAVTVTIPENDVRQPSADLPDLRLINARIKDQGGNVSPVSNNFQVNIDTNIAMPVVNTTQGAAAGIDKAQAKDPVVFYGSGVELDAKVTVKFTGVLGQQLLANSVGRAGGFFEVTLQPNDLTSLGEGAVTYRVEQLDPALNTSEERVGSFDLRLSTPEPTLLNMTQDNVVSEFESRSPIVYQGLGIKGLQVQVKFYVPTGGVYPDPNALPDPAVVTKTVTVKTDGTWDFTLSTDELKLVSPQGQGTVLVLAKQVEDGSTSGAADLEFYIDRQLPTLATTKNLLTYTQNLDNTNWTKQAANLGVRTDVIAAPAVGEFGGTMTADAIVVPNLSVSQAAIDARVSQTFVVTPNKHYTVSTYVKNGTAGLPVLEMASAYKYDIIETTTTTSVVDGVPSTTTTTAIKTPEIYVRQWFNLFAGTKGNATTGNASLVSISNSDIEAVGDGWYRVSYTFMQNKPPTPAVVTTNPSPGVTVTVTSVLAESYYSELSLSTRSAFGSSAGVKGNGTPSVYVWGTQSEEVATPTAPPTAYVPVTNTPSVKLFDADGDGANRDGLLVTFGEPVAVSNLENIVNYTAGQGKTLGTVFRVQAQDSRSINGQYFATQFKLFLDNDNTLAQGNTITIARGAIVDAGGNSADLNAIISVPNISVPGLPTPPSTIMGDNRINRDESAGISSLSYTDTRTAANFNAAVGGLLNIGVSATSESGSPVTTIDQIIPRANMLVVDITLSKAVKLNQGASATIRVNVTQVDGTVTALDLTTVGSVSTQNTATNKYRFSAAYTNDLLNVTNVVYSTVADFSAFRQPITAPSANSDDSPTWWTGNVVSGTEGITITRTGSGTTWQSTVNVGLKFPNPVRLAAGVTSTATVYAYFDDTAKWETFTVSVMGNDTTAAAGGVTFLNYSTTIPRQITTGGGNFVPNWVPSNLIQIDPNPNNTPGTNFSVITSGADQPVVSVVYNGNLVVPDAILNANPNLKTQLLDKDLVPIAGTEQNLSYVRSNPSQILYTQSVGDALNVAGRKLQLFVDGIAVGPATTMGISQLNMQISGRWENASGNPSGWGTGMNQQAGTTLTAWATVTFKAGTGLDPVEIEMKAPSTQNVGNDPIQFFSKFEYITIEDGVPKINAIDPTLVSTIAYKPGSLSQLNPNITAGSAVSFSTSQFVALPSSAWEGQTDGLKQLTAQMSTADGTLTSVFAAPKQIRLDKSVGTITNVELLVDVNNSNNSNNLLEAGDTLQLRFSEPVVFTFSALPSSFGTSTLTNERPVVTPVAPENGLSQIWNVKLGAGASVPLGSNLVLQAGKVFDAAGNDNSTGPAVQAVIPTTLFDQPGTPVIANVKTLTTGPNNVVTSNSADTAVTINLSKAKVGDVVTLFMDGVQIGIPQTLTATNLTSATFTVPGSQWGADGERTLTSTITRGGSTAKSALRSVYVAADTAHWSQESSLGAGNVHWFDPDAIVGSDITTQADGRTTVNRWVASAGGLTLNNTQASTIGSVIKVIDARTGHAQLWMNGSAVFQETKLAGGVGGFNNQGYLYVPPTMARTPTDTTVPGAGYTDFSMFQPIVQGAQALMQHPVFRYTANANAVTYIPLVNGVPQPNNPITVQPYTKVLRAVGYNYSFSGATNTLSVRDPGTGINGVYFSRDMSNVIGTGSWQMFTAVNRTYTGFLYNQMRLNDTSNLPNWIPSSSFNPLSHDLMLQSADTAQRRFQIGGGGTGLLGDQISVSVATGDAYNQEVASYLAAKYQSTGSVVARNAVLTNTTYNLSLSAVPGTLIDQALLLVDAVSADTVTTAGADYVNTGAGNDTVLIKDLAFRHIDGGQGYDTLKLAAGFTGTTSFTLADFISNFRGMSNTGQPDVDKVNNQRVNDAGYHRLLGFEKLDFVQEGETLNRRQIVTVSASDVNLLSETNTLEFNLGREDVILPVGFSSAEYGIFQVNGNYYDRQFTQSVAGQTVNLYTSGGDRVPEVVSFRTVGALNQVQFTFDHAMKNAVLPGHFSIEQSGMAISTNAVSAISVNLRQGVQLTLNQPLSNVSKIIYSGLLADDPGRGFNHTIWSIGTGASDTLNGSNWSASQQLKGATFLAGQGNDAIIGTSGADLIVGGLGSDVLTGGLGSDTFYYRNEITGSGSSGGLGGSSGDVITDFTWNHVDGKNNDRIDLSLLFEKNFQATGNAVTDAALLTTGMNGSIGGFLDLRKVTNFDTGKQDIEIWADRDGGGLYGILATISNGGTNLPVDYPAVETNQALLTRLIEQGRMVVSTF